ncbi:MAG: TrmB family transcriptional regulator [Clostridia bacterium]|nr:TrmB family transcriptional regulator [Clostridia bacterium]
MDVVESLVKLQLSRQEATVYALLSSEGPLTGYEVSKLSGISRSNTYTALAGLVEKGAAHIIEGTATRYTPVAIGEFCENKIGEIQEIKAFLQKAMTRRVEEEEGYITIKGERHILDKMRTIIKNAKERVYLSVSHAVLDEVLGEVKDAVDRKIKVVLITNPPFSLSGATLYFTEKEQEQIRLIADSHVVLTGDIGDKTHSTCLFSQKKNLVDLFKDALKNEIRLIELTKNEKE